MLNDNYNKYESIKLFTKNRWNSYRQNNHYFFNFATYYFFAPILITCFQPVCFFMHTNQHIKVRISKISQKLIQSLLKNISTRICLLLPLNSACGCINNESKQYIDKSYLSSEATGGLLVSDHGLVILSYLVCEEKDVGLDFTTENLLGTLKSRNNKKL